MAIILHKNIGDTERHNPKGFESANFGDYFWKNEEGELEYIDELVLPSALNFVDASVAPPTTNTGDIYVLASGGSVDAGWGTASLGDWVRYNGTEYKAITPQKSTLCYNENDDKLYSYDGSTWSGVGGNISDSDLTFNANHYADLGAFSWTLGGTAPIGTEKISFQRDTLVKGSDTSASTKGFEIVDQVNSSLWNWRNNGDIYQSKASTWFQGGSLTIDAVANNISIIDSGNVNSGTLSRTSGQGFIFNRSTTTGALTVQQSGANKVLLGSNADYWGSSKIYLGSTTGSDGLTIETDRIRYYTSVGSAGVIHDIHADRFALFGSGFSTPSNSYISFGSFTRIGTENISLQGDTLVGKTGSKVGFIGTAPIVKVTTGVSAGAFVANTSGISDDTATFGGYTIGQIAQALINYGLLT